MSLLDYAIDGLNKAKREHLVVAGDCQFSCPDSDEPCTSLCSSLSHSSIEYLENDYGTGCTCGAEQHNRAIDICIHNLRTMTKRAGELRPSGW